MLISSKKVSFPTPGQWNSAGIVEPIQRFFVLVWSEMFGVTLDTWQVRTTNVTSALSELVTAVDRVAEFDGYRHNIPHILEEAEVLSERDPVLKDHYPFVAEYVRAMKKHKDQLDRVARTAELLLFRLNGYRQTLVRELRTELATPGSTAKERVSKLAMALATDVASAGYSKRYLQATLDHLVAPPQQAFADRFDTFIDCCNGVRHEYACYFKVNWPRLGQTGLGHQGLSVRPGVPPFRGNSAAATHFFAAAQPRDFFAFVNVEAPDPYAARLIAEGQLADAIAAATIYSPEQRNAFGSKGGSALVIRTSDGTAQEIADDVDNLSVQDVTLPTKRTSDLLTLLTSRAREDQHQIIAALQYHRLAVLGSTNEVRLVNLWIALECLIRRSPGGSIIEKVCSTVPSVVALNNITKIARGLARYLRWMWRNSSPQFLPLFPNSSQTRLEVADLLDVMLEGPQGPRMQKLFALCAGHDLLLYRLHHFVAHSLDTGKTIAKNLEYHKRNIEWQLRRIYRARNEVTHRAKSAVGVDPLIQHLHTYLTTTVLAVVHDMRKHPEWSLAHVFEHRRTLFEYAVGRLVKLQRTEITSRMLLDLDTILDPV